MIYKQLGRTDLNVSLLCLGSMTWGTQNTLAEGHAQIDMALDHGINFIDTAEMYPTNPLSKETQGDTERVIGQWVEQSGRRDKVIIATKVSGEGFMNVRDGAPISPATIRIALETSLRSMRTDYVDLYQIHRWDDATPIEETMEALHDIVKAGKALYLGASSMYAWQFVELQMLAEMHGWTGFVSMQNHYNLIFVKQKLELNEFFFF